MRVGAHCQWGHGTTYRTSSTNETAVMRSGSLWTAAVPHASHNLFIQTVFDNMMRDTGKTLWYTTEFGVALAVVNVGIAVYFWTRRREVEERSSLAEVAAA
jgi:hypothetical protein